MNNYTPRIRSRKLWDRHGSWLILFLVVALAWNGGSEWQAYKTRQIVTTIVEAGVAERNILRARLRQVYDDKQKIIETYAPAAAKTDDAMSKANQAVDKADQTVEKLNDILKNGDLKVP